MMKQNLRKLEQALGYRFKKHLNLELALTHPSYRYETADIADDNQRLEFLGDAALSLTTAEHLYETEPNMREGDMSKLRSRLTEDRKLAEIAAALGISEHLLLGRGEAGSGGAERPSNLADTLEAILGAAWIDGGMRATRKIFKKVFLPALNNLDDDSIDSENPKGKLQEFSQKNGFGIPVYVIVDKSGPDHDHTFTVEVRVCDKYWEGKAGSKREAERLAAIEALNELVQENEDK